MGTATYISLATSPHTLTLPATMHTHSFLLSLLLAAASADIAPDLKCFNDNIHFNTSLANGTFEVRIEHAGSITDWFDNGDVFPISVGKKLEYNTTAKSMDDLCIGCSDDLKNQLKEIGKVPRYLYMGYDGVNVYGGMMEMIINVNSTTAKETWGECKFSKQTATPEMDMMTFTYIRWYVDAGVVSLPWEPEDKLYVHGGGNSSIASCVTIVVFLFLSKIL